MITKNYFPPDVDIYNDLGTYVIIGNSSTANHIVLTIDSYNVYQKIKKVILFLPCNSDTNQEDFKIKENSSSTRISYANKVIRNNIYYLCFELTPYFNSSPSCTVFSFLLLNNDTDDFSIPNYSSMFLQIVHEEPFDYLNNLSLIQRKIGSSYIYKHDIITSYGFLSKDLYEKSFPYELKLVADMYEPNNQFFDFLPKGWTLNLLERIIVDQNNNSYILIDGDFIRHKFYNNSNSSALIYVDDYGTGLLMEKVDASTYKVFSPINSAIKFFNADGKITKSVLENGKEINFSYTNSTIIISDYLGNTLTINKVSNTSITIVSSAINKIYTLTINSNCLIGLSCIGSNDLTTVSDSYTYDNNSRLSQLNTFDGYKLFITSDFDNYSFTIKKATTDLEKYSFARYLRYVEVTHLNGIVYKYYFDDDHNINVFGENTGGLEDYDCILFQSPLLKSFSELYKITIKEHLTVQLYHSTDLQTPVFDSNSPYSITATRQDAATNTVIVTKAIQTEMDQTKPRFILFRVNNNPSFINSEISKLNLGLFRGEVTSLDSSVSLFDISFIGEGYCLCQIPPYIPHNQFSIGYDGNCGYFTISDVYFLQLDNCPNGNLLFRKNDSSSSNFISIGDNNKYFPISSIKFDSRQLYENDIKINQIIYRKYSYAKYFFTNNLRDLFLFTDNGTYRSVDIDFFEDYTSETPSSINVQFENTVFAFYQEQNSVLKQASIISTNDAASYKVSQFLSKGTNVYKKKTILDYHGRILLDTEYDLVSESSGVTTVKNYSSSTSNLESIQVKPSSGSPIYNESYGYDTNNRLTTATRNQGSTTSTTQYQYVSTLSVINKITDGRNVDTLFEYSPNYEFINKVSRSSGGNTDYVTTTSDIYSRVTSYHNQLDEFDFSYNTRNEISSIVYKLFEDLPEPGVMSIGDQPSSLEPNIIIQGDDINLVYNTYTHNTDTSKTIVTKPFYNPPPINSYTITTNYDKYGRITSQSDGTYSTSFTYDSQYGFGKLSGISFTYNNTSLISESFSYDAKQRLNEFSKTIHEPSIGFQKSYQYDDYERIQYENTDLFQTLITTPTCYKQYYYNDKNDDVTAISIIYNNLFVAEVKAVDSLNRPSAILTSVDSHSLGMSGIQYSIFDTNKTSFEVSRVDYSNGKYSIYTYDLNGNITSITGNSGEYVSSFQYDNHNQLIKEIRSNESYYIDYVYDCYGNLLSATKKNYHTNQLIQTDTFEYENAKLRRLKKYNGSNIFYNQFMCPTSLNGATLAYTRCNKLASYAKSGTTTTYKYDHEGMRYSKQTGSDETYFIYDENKKLIFEKRSNILIHYLYGLSGLIGFTYGSDVYYYLKNIQGDILGIYQYTNNNFTLVAKYTYDAYGNHQVLNPNGTVNTSPTFIGNISPFRYRSYYYDTESGFYYCQSRYYVPYLRRWLTIDDLSYLNNQNVYGLNLFRYCDNNPVMKKDETGHYPTLVGSVIFGAIFGAIFGFLGGFFQFENGRLNPSIEKGIIGAISGFAFGALGGYIGFIMNSLISFYISSSIASFALNLASQTISKTLLSHFEDSVISSEHNKDDLISSFLESSLESILPSKFSVLNEFAAEMIMFILYRIKEYND